MLQSVGRIIRYAGRASRVGEPGHYGGQGLRCHGLNQEPRYLSRNMV